jgi:uncharacterized protein
MTRSRTLLITLLTAAALLGCGTSPQAKFYTLNPAGGPATANTAAPIVVAIGAISLPDLVDRPQIVTTAGANQVTMNEFARWAEPLRDAIPRIVADNLTQMLNGASVYVYPQSAGVKADYKLLINVQQFDSALGNAATLVVLWNVQSVKSGETKSGRAIIREATGGDKGYDALVAAHSRALTAVSRDIAAAISQ